jgi:hypothetical protein
MVRSAYNASLKGRRYVSIKRMLKKRYGIANARWRQWAIDEAEANIEGQRELLPLYAADFEWKIERIKGKMARTANPLKREGYAARTKAPSARIASYWSALTSQFVCLGL